MKATVMSRLRLVDPNGDGLLWEPVTGDPHVHTFRCKIWCSPMLRDVDRNLKYADAIRLVTLYLWRKDGRKGAEQVPEADKDVNVSKERLVVIDIDIGSGILVMIAAREGGKSCCINTCEMMPDVAKLASSVLKCDRHLWADGGAETSLHQVHANTLTVGCEEVNREEAPMKHGTNAIPMTDSLSSGTGTIPRRAGLMLVELLDSTLLQEGYLSVVRDAWQRLLRGGAVVVPSGASVWGQLVSSDELSFHDLSQVHTAVLEFL